MEINKWLGFIRQKVELHRYLSKLKSTKTQQDETLAEIVSAYILVDLYLD